jgi:hypothetical protein
LKFIAWRVRNRWVSRTLNPSALERREEAVVESTPEVARRPDADPRAVLGVDVGTAARAA